MVSATTQSPPPGGDQAKLAAEGRFARLGAAAQRHSTLVTAVCTVLAALLTLLATVVGAWATTTASERDELEASQQALSGENATLQAANEALRAEVDDLQSEVERLVADADANEVPGTEEPSTDAPSDDTAAATPAAVRTPLTSLDLIDGGAEWSIAPVVISGEEYGDGLATQVFSGMVTEAAYSLGRDHTRLQGTAGLADNSNSTAGANLQIMVDGEVVLSEPLELGNPVAIDVDVTDGLRLVLSVSGTNGEIAALGDLTLLS